MADDEHQVTRQVVYYDDAGQVSDPGLLVDPLVVFFRARLEEHDVPDGAAKIAILDDYERRCHDTANPARRLECQLIRSVIKQLVQVYAEHHDYQPEWSP